MRTFVIVAFIGCLFAGCKKNVVDDYVKVYRQATEEMESVGSTQDFMRVSQKNEEVFRCFEAERGKELDALGDSPESVVKLMEAQQLYGQTAAGKAQHFMR